ARRPRGVAPRGLCPTGPVDHDGRLEKSQGLLPPVLLLRGPPALSRPRRPLPGRGHLRPAHQTARLLPRAGPDRRPLVERTLPASPPHFDHAGRLLARPPRAILRALLDPPLPSATVAL